jgi:hypothetical protein
MLATHPITGKQIRIMKTETQLHKDNKTAVWLNKSPNAVENAQRFKRWMTATSSIELAEEWKTVLGSYPSVIVLTTPSEQNRIWLSKKAPKQKTLLFLSRSVMEHYGLERFTNEGFTNILCLEELSELYPYISRKYSEKDSEAIAVLYSFAVYRVHRIVGFSEEDIGVSSFLDSLRMVGFSEEDMGISSLLNSLNKIHKIIVEPFRSPEPLWLIQQYFTPQKAKREREIKHCLQKNLDCSFVDKILLLNEEDYSAKLPKSEKIQQEILGHRMTYADVMRTIYEKVPKGTLVVFANSDIYLDDSWSELWSINLKDKFLSLLRYEEPTHSDEELKLFGPREDSQDTWVVHADSVKERVWKDFKDLDFQFGKAGCDNAINVEMLRKKFVVANPCKSLRTIHCHASQIRTYNPNDVLDKPLFLYLEPTGLHDLNPVADLKKNELSWDPPSYFSRKVHAIDEKARTTFCRMVSRDDLIKLEPQNDNMFVSQQEEKLYQFQNSFVTPNGLVYGYDKLYLGASQKVREEWVNTTISHLTPSIGVQSVLAAPFPDTAEKNAWTYCTQYLAKVLRMKEKGYEGEFWLPKHLTTAQEMVQRFQWGGKGIPVIPKEKDVGAFGTSVTMLEPRQTPLVYKEEIDALRKYFSPYCETILHPNRVTIIQDDILLTHKEVEQLENVLENLGYEINVIYPSRSSASFILQRLSGVAYCIFSPNSEDLLWMLPSSAKVLEVMMETKITGNGAHMAGACSLEYWITLLPREKGDAKTAAVVEKICDTLEMMKEATREEPQLSRIIVPKGFSGFHEHAGDSFREMVEIWEEKGLVTIEKSSSSPYVWWNKIGDTLLYDRASFDWLKATPSLYKNILCGNPDASSVKQGIQWSFWPRHPKLVEELASATRNSWKDRTQQMVFYGRIENEVQLQNRSNQLVKACTDYDIPVGPEAPYKYSPKEYLKALSKSKFGLCLSGFGAKCNREIECMALGTVPVVAPDVDMEHYASVPQDGIHYIRLKTFNPEEAKTVIESISEEEWMSLSVSANEWWRQNASADGLFELTKKLCK